ncbi:MAG: glutamate--tRNA ligase [Armatimonadota bacterium]|nr:glutamate--tRNA ligase [Armatimonadota bacterium]MCX7776699.1 glutamate--tRNA ligase [Armatimonadota bacterium]MDW8026337.1 glutamate--tRNA ligase [Armatimonadota bacterium]
MVRVRIAPAPTGALHVGTARTALFNWLFARKHGGEFLLRIEDTDKERSRYEFVEQIIEGLKWLGLEWDEGPFFQSERLQLYRQEAYRLLEEGRAYLCFCTPEELEERRKQMLSQGLPPRYDRRCRCLDDAERKKLLNEGRKYVLRFAMPIDGETRFHDLVRGEITVRNDEMDDFVILKSDGTPTYNFACVVDDREMRITHVIRGEDHIPNTPRQIQLYIALGYELPQFAHLPLLLGRDRSKLSKRHGATSLLEYRNMGVLAEAMFNFLALLGWSPGGSEGEEIFSRDELIERFDITQVKPSGAIFNPEKLLWMNAHYIRQCDLDRLTKLCIPYLKGSNLISENPNETELKLAQRAIELVRDRMKLLSDVPSLCDYFFKDPIEYDPDGVRKWFAQDNIAMLLDELAQRLERLLSFDVATIESTLRGLAQEHGISAARLIHPTRLAITGRTIGPGLFELMEVVGKDACVRRLRRCASWVRASQKQA